jgi:hypothetical protein
MNNDRFRQRFAKRIDKTQGKLDIFVRRLVLDIDKRLVMKTPVDTGRAKANWNVSSGSINTGTRMAVSSAGRGQYDNYNQAEIVSIKVNGQKIYLTNSLPYIRRLEFGYSKQAPAGMVRTTLAEMQPIIKAIAAEVKAL